MGPPEPAAPMSVPIVTNLSRVTLFSLEGKQKGPVSAIGVPGHSCPPGTALCIGPQVTAAMGLFGFGEQPWVMLCQCPRCQHPLPTVPTPLAHLGPRWPS